MVELRKRKTPPPAPEPKQKKERKTKAKASTNGDAPAEAAPEAESSKSAPEVAPEAAPVEEEKPEAKKTSGGPPKTGDKIDFEGFGGEVETNDGEKVTLKSLVEKSEAGVVLFTYPKASTPGCRSCLFCCEFLFSRVFHWVLVKSARCSLNLYFPVNARSFCSPPFE